MDVTHMEHTGRRCAVCLGLIGAAVMWLSMPALTQVDRSQAVKQAQAFLDAPAETAELSPDGRTWTVEAEGEVATLDAKTGELLEIQF